MSLAAGLTAEHLPPSPAALAFSLKSLAGNLASRDDQRRKRKAEALRYRVALPNVWQVTRGIVRRYEAKRGNMLTTVLIIILILILLGAFPAWPYSRGWGYGPSGVVGLILVILLILLLLGKI